MKIDGTTIDDTFAEAFRMRYIRLIITAVDPHWVDCASRELTGYGTSIIACDAEAGIEHPIAADASPDGRPGAALLFFGFSAEALGNALVRRVGQCLMTCPTSAGYDGLPTGDTRVPLGKHLRFFGDGYQRSKVIAGRRFWRVPVMDGEFLCEESAGVEKGIAGGNIIVQGTSQAAALEAARAAVEAIALLPGVITPFPGGVVRSGSKVGSRYRALKASTNDEFCPSVRSRVNSRLHPDATCAYEIVIDGVDDPSVRRAMATAIRAAATSRDVPMISAGNYGGKLGKFLYPLREVLE